MIKKALLFYIAGLISLNTFAQKTLVYEDDNSIFKTALELFEKGKYSAARNQFELFLNTQPSEGLQLEAAYYRNIAAFRLFHKDAKDLCDDFIANNENHYYTNLTRFELGNLYYDQKNYKEAIAYLSEVTFSQIEAPTNDEGRFKLGYSYFMQRDYESALPFLEKARVGTHKFTYAAYYYSGYIHFRKGNFKEALDRFKRAEGHPAYKNIVPYMKVNILQRQHRWTELATYADSVLQENPKTKNADIIYMLAAEGHFRQNHYKKAAAYFSNYTKQNKKPDDKILYRLAYCHYKSEEYTQAIEEFKQLALKDDTMSQHVAYYLGQSYLKTDNKEFALGAFLKAANVDYDPTIREESMFNVAKLSYERKQFEQSIKYLLELQKLNPTHANQQEAKDLLSKNYLSTNNYDRAIQYIEAQRYKSVALKKVYQKVTFYKAVEYFNTEAYEAAQQMFDKSLEYKQDKEFEIAATFWKGEIYSLRKEWSKAQSLYAYVFRNNIPATQEYYDRSRYGIGYAYFNTEEYNKALIHFDNYLKSKTAKKDKKVFGDAMLRLADCHYKKEEFSVAASEYQKAIELNVVNKDYAYLQKGVIHGKFLNKYSVAISSLNKVIKDYSRSPYVDDALFNKGIFMLEQKEYRTAEATFNRIITKYQGGPLEAPAMYYRALAFENLQRYDKALDQYADLIIKYCRKPEAVSAIKTLGMEASKYQNQDKIQSLLDSYESCNPEDKQTAGLRFDFIEDLFKNARDYEKVIQKGEEYLVKFPGAEVENDLNYYLAESYYQTGNKEKALTYFELLIKTPKYNFYTKALDRSGAIHLANENYTGAINSYKKLFVSSTSKRKQLNALNGLTKSYYALEQYDSVLYYADQTIERLNSIVSARNQANLYRGKAYLGKGDTLKATEVFTSLVTSEQDINAAEAQYIIAQIHFNKGEYRASIDSCYALDDKFSAAGVWIGEAYILIGDNYKAQEELAQAMQVWQSLLEFPDEGIQQKANERITALGAEEAAKEASLEVPVNDTIMELPTDSINIFVPENDEEGGDDEDE